MPSIKQQLQALVTNGLDKRIDIKDDLSADFYREIIMCLKDSAVGVQLKQVTYNRAGKAVERVYQRAPDVKAIQLLLELYNFFPDSYANMLLSMARMEKELATKLAVVDQRKYLQAQTEKVQLDATAYRMATIEPEAVAAVIQQVVQGMIGWMQSISRDTMMENFTASDEDYQKLAIQFAQRAHEIQTRALDNMEADILPAIVGGSAEE